MSDGRLVVVTGAAGGIGRRICLEMVERGYSVLAVDQVPSTVGTEHAVVNLASSECGARLASIVGERPVAGLVNNAAASSTTATHELTADEWDMIHAVNLRAPFLLSQALLPALRRGGGSVVNVSSVHAFETSAGAVAYAASKGGLNALTRALAVDWSARGESVRVNAVAPAAIDTPMLVDGLERTGTTLEQLGRRHPLGRVGTTTEVARAVAFLLGQEAGYIHGVVLPVDGGALAQLSTEVVD